MLYYNNHPYYLNGDQGINLFVVSIITIVTGIYDSRWRASSRSRLLAIGRIYSSIILILSLFLKKYLIATFVIDYL